MENQPKELREYQTAEGKAPFRDWLSSLRDVHTRARIITRLKRLAYGHFGDCLFAGGGVFELRIHFGPGYRVYFGEDKGTVIILLCAGDKHSQSRDIEKAKRYWDDYRGRP